MCGPTPEQIKVIDSVGEVALSLSAMAVNISSGMLPSELPAEKGKQESTFTADFDDENDPFYNENINGQISITYSIPTVDGDPIEISDGYSTPFESFDFSEGPVFPDGSPLNGDFSAYLQNLLDADPSTGEVDLDSQDMNDIITAINDDVVTSGNPIGAIMSATIVYTDFSVPAEMDCSLTGTVTISVRLACGAKVTGTVESGSSIVMDENGMDVDVTGTVKPGLRLAFELEFNTTDLQMIEDEETTTVTMTDLLIDGYFTETISAGATVKIVNSSTQNEFSITDVNISHSIEDQTNFSGGEIIVDGQTLPSNFAGTDIGQKLFTPIMNFIEDNMDTLIDTIENGV
jgi:hypothetical protein